MGEHNVTINFFPIDLLERELNLYVSNQKPEELHNEFLPYQLIKLNEVIQKDERFWSFNEFSNSRKVILDPRKDLSIAKKYVTMLIYQYFAEKQEVYTSHDFIGAIGIYEKGASIVNNNNELQELRIFTIRCEYWDSTKRFGIVVSKGRNTYCTTKPYSSFKTQIPINRINRVIFNRKVGYFSDFSGIVKKQDFSELGLDIDLLWHSLVGKGYIDEEGAIQIAFRNLQTWSNMDVDNNYVNEKEKIYTILQNCHSKQGLNDDAFYLLRSRDLGDIFPLYKSGSKRENKYFDFHKDIIGFVKKYLFEKELGQFVRFPYSQLMMMPEKDIFRTPRESNLLSFQHNQTTFNVYTGLKEFGPSFIPDEVSKVKFMFILHQDDSVLANKFLSYIVKGYRGFPGFSQFVGVPVSNENVDKTKTIRYTNDNPVDEILAKIKELDFSDGKYVAFYLSRIHKDEQDFEKRKVYFRIKEALLSKGVVSQVIDEEKLNDQYYNFYLPNIAIALLAKLEGIPWKLASPASPDLIVGIGAKRKDNNVFFGNTICFRNDGTFEEFDAFVENNLLPLGNAFKTSIKSYVDNNPNAERLVIHFYKKMSNKEEKQLLSILSELDISIPYVVLTITDNPSKDYVIFDEEFDGLMPVSGTYVRIRKNMYLLANNQRYENTTTLKISDFPFPVKICFSKCRDVDLNNIVVVNDLIYQVYQFSRVYWRSIRQKAKPVTILYSEIIAEMVSCFLDGKLPQSVVSHKALWFL